MSIVLIEPVFCSGCNDHYMHSCMSLWIKASAK
uniref:Uncharacterized protein n=1 Tax=Anguilla anguilla TaxID=7936 RepID=A0A0E9XX38_ANGAN